MRYPRLDTAYGTDQFGQKSLEIHTVFGNVALRSVQKKKYKKLEAHVPFLKIRPTFPLKYITGFQTLKLTKPPVFSPIYAKAIFHPFPTATFGSRTTAHAALNPCFS